MEEGGTTRTRSRAMREYCIHVRAAGTGTVRPRHNPIGRGEHPSRPLSWGISRAAPREKELSVRGVMCARTVHATHASHVLVVVVVSSPSSCSSSSSSRLSLSLSLSLSSRRYYTYGTPLVNVTTSGALAALPRPLNRFQRRPTESAATPSAAPLMDEKFSDLPPPATSVCSSLGFSSSVLFFSKLALAFIAALVTSCARAKSSPWPSS